MCIRDRIGKARGSKQGNNLLVQKVRESGGIDFSLPILLGYTGLSDALLQKYVADSAALWRCLLYTSIPWYAALARHVPTLWATPHNSPSAFDGHFSPNALAELCGAAPNVDKSISLCYTLQTS